MNVIAKDIPLNNYFVCKVCPSCILKKDKFTTRNAICDDDDDECWNMVELLGILNKFTKEIDGRELCVVNVEGRSTEKIGETLLSAFAKHIFS